MINIYSDGAWDPISGRGGWAAVVVEDSRKQVFSGVVESATSNRMEITAALEGILRAPESAELIIHTDSQYVLGCATKGWQRRANRDLWEKLDGALTGRKVKWEFADPNNELQKEAHAVATSQVSRKTAENPAPPGTPALKKPALTHVDEAGRPKMVDVAPKPDTEREATARGVVRMQPATFNLITEGRTTKGDALSVAQLAGIMAAKQTASLIPLCHPVLINNVGIAFSPQVEESAIEISATVSSTGKTGVEMEALTAVAVAALTIYDMCKAVDRGMRIENIRLVRKSGGKSGTIVLE